MASSWGLAFLALRMIEASRVFLGNGTPLHLGAKCNGWEWQMSKIIREPSLRWRADILKKETA